MSRETFHGTRGDPGSGAVGSGATPDRWEGSTGSGSSLRKTTWALSLLARLSFLAALAHGEACGAAEALTEVQVAVQRLRSEDDYERQRAETDLLRLGPQALPLLVRVMETDGDPVTRLRAEALFRELMDELLAGLERESRALSDDRSELSSLRNRREFVQLRKQLSSTIEEWSKLDPPLTRVVESLLRLEALRARKQAGAAAPSQHLTEEEEAELLRLTELRSAWKSQRSRFEEVEKPLLRLALLEMTGVTGGPLTELQEMRIQDLESRIQTREPRVQSAEKEILTLGPASLNAMVAQGILLSGSMTPHAATSLQRSFGESGLPAIPMDADSLEKVRYSRSLLWRWEVDRRGPQKESAESALRAHFDLVLLDLDSPDPVVADRAAIELYLLGDSGIAALEERAKALGDSGRARYTFLLRLLRWRILPQTYERTGTDFRNYRSLGVRARRQAVFDYARTAGNAAIPTLRKIVGSSESEPSLLVRIGAAKALAGLRDMWGFEFLLREHPDLTLTRPEVSRDLAIVQGVDQIREKQYEQAVRTLAKVLDEFPFDFQANYHIAFAYLLLKDYAKSIRHFEIAKRINPGDQLTLYNLACAYALGGKADEALREIEASVDAGFDDADHIRQDDDLKSLRSDPRFQRLIERIERASSNATK